MSLVMEIPAAGLVVLIGPRGAGKSDFAARCFAADEIIVAEPTADVAECSPPESASSASPEAQAAAVHDRLSPILAKATARLTRLELAVVDGRNLSPDERRAFLRVAKDCDLGATAIAFDLPEQACRERLRQTAARGGEVRYVHGETQRLKQALHKLRDEGFKQVYCLSSADDVATAVVERRRLAPDRRDDFGPFDIIGDVHGCGDELERLLARLGYLSCESPAGDAVWSPVSYRHPDGRKAVFVGDLVDRGPRVVDVVRIVHNMVRDGTALCAPGNHDMKLYRQLVGRQVSLTHGLAQSVAEIEALPESIRSRFRSELAAWLDGLPSHYVLDGGRLVVAHAGMQAEYQGRTSGRVREFALYGETTGRRDEYDLPIRGDWASRYTGSALVVFGHTPVGEPLWAGETVNIDTGCVFGGRLTALRYPERAAVSVPAAREYAVTRRPFLSQGGGVGRE